jgi:hypothetical protein
MATRDAMPAVKACIDAGILLPTKPAALMPGKRLRWTDIGRRHSDPKNSLALASIIPVTSKAPSA